MVTTVAVELFAEIHQHHNTCTPPRTHTHTHTHPLSCPTAHAFHGKVERIRDCFLILPPPPVLSLFHTYPPSRFTLVIGTVILFIPSPSLLHFSLSTLPPLYSTFRSPPPPPDLSLLLRAIVVSTPSLLSRLYFWTLPSFLQSGFVFHSNSSFPFLLDFRTHSPSLKGLYFLCLNASPLPVF